MPTPAPFARKDTLGPLTITYVAVSALRPDPHNARIHPERQLKLLARSLRDFGFIIPVVITGDFQILCGHARVLAARKAGIEQVPTVRVEHLSPTQTRAFQIADNRLAELAIWDERQLALQLQALTTVDLDFELESTGFSIGEIDLRIEALEQSQTTSDPADEPMPHTVGPPVSKINDLWYLGPHRLLCCNALDENAYRTLMNGQRATMVFTDPPYNVPIDGFAGGNGKIHHREFAMASGEMSSEEFEIFLTRVLGHLGNASVNGALHYVCMDWRHLGELLGAGKKVYTELKNVCVWCKDRAGMGSLYRSQHELVFVFKYGKGRHRNNVELGKHGRHRSNVWHYAAILSERRGEEGDLLALHPTVKPLRLVADAILDVSARGEIVLDPFLGSGTTLLACQRVGRVCFGMEIDPLHLDTAIRRWQQFTGEQAVHLATGKTFDELALQTKKDSAQPKISDLEDADAEV